MTKSKILYVEDDLTLAFITQDNLRQAGYDVVLCDNKKKALEALNDEKFNLIILDIMLPDGSGMEIAEEIRQKDVSVPILFLTAKVTLESKLAGLKIGADDYITKPYSIEELLLKVQIFLKRSLVVESTHEENRIISLGKYKFNVKERILSTGKIQNQLTHRESLLLVYLIENQDKICKREEILQSVWENTKFFSSRSLDVFISRLRKLLSSDPNIKIENVHGMGYRLVV